jgi:hypothetical protein
VDGTDHEITVVVDSTSAGLNVTSFGQTQLVRGKTANFNVYFDPYPHDPATQLIFNGVAFSGTEPGGPYIDYAVPAPLVTGNSATIFLRTPSGNASEVATLPILDRVIGNVQPNGGAVDEIQAVTVYGAGFVNGDKVQQDGVDAVTTFVSATELTAELVGPATPGTDVIGVVKADGTGDSTPFTFNWEAPAVLTSLTPNTADDAGGNVEVAIAGTGLPIGGSVFVNGGGGAGSVISATSATVTLFANPGTDEVSVRSPGGVESNKLTFTWT